MTTLQSPGRCPVCLSTNRAPYSNRNEEECITTIGDGIPVTHRISQLTKCTDCGQARYDIGFENRTPLPPEHHRPVPTPTGTKRVRTRKRN